MHFHPVEQGTECGFLCDIPTFSDVPMRKLTQLAKDFIGECWHGHFNQRCISDFLSSNCLHQKTIGKGIGIKSFITDCHDWSLAFPDYGTEIKTMEEYRGLVICDIGRTGTHTEWYKSTNPNKKTILTTSDFFKRIEKAPPTGKYYSLPAKLIFAFEKEKISQIIIEEDPLGMAYQLGLMIPPPPQIVPSFEDDICVLANAINNALSGSLTLREMECLALSFCGFSAKHLAEILKISVLDPKK